MAVEIIDCFGYTQLPLDLQAISKEFSKLAQKVNCEQDKEQDYKELHAKIGGFQSDKPFMTAIAKKRVITASNTTLFPHQKLIFL